jgi:AraC-like DNA-binding protein
MKSEHTIRPAAAVGLLEAVERAGGRPERVLAKAGLVMAELRRPDRAIELRAMVALFEAAAEESGDDFFGLHLGQSVPLRSLGELSYVVLNAPDVGTAMRNLERYLGLYMTGASVSIDIEAGLVKHRLLFDDPSLFPRRQFVELNAAMAHDLLKSVAGSDWSPDHVQFEHDPPRSVDEYTAVFGAPVRFGCSTSCLAYDAEWMTRPVLGADRSLLPIVEKHVREILGRSAGESDLAAAVGESVAECLCDGSPSISVIARGLAMSARTLQRRLEESGTCFRDIVDDVRRRLAAEYLRDDDTSVTEVSFLLGYSELSAFHHAFRRWTGSTPRLYRKRLA